MEVYQAKGHRVLCYYGALHVSRGTHPMARQRLKQLRADMLHQFRCFRWGCQAVNRLLAVLGNA